jgi:hypothetical protein
MEKTKTSKKVLSGLINNAIQEALSKLELPQPGKKIKKLIAKDSKRLASVFADVIKREQKKKQKTEKTLTYVEDVLKGKKVKKAKAGRQAEK